MAPKRIAFFVQLLMRFALALLHASLHYFHTSPFTEEFVAKKPQQEVVCCVKNEHVRDLGEEECSFGTWEQP